VGLGDSVAVGAGLVGMGGGVLVVGPAVAVAVDSVGAAWETAVAWRTAVSVQPMRRKRDEISKKPAVALDSAILIRRFPHDFFDLRYHNLRLPLEIVGVVPEIDRNLIQKLAAGRGIINGGIF